MRWKVKLKGITWDDGKGEHDVSDLPKDVDVLVIADKDVALEHAMTEVSDTYGALIAEVQTFEMELVPDRRNRHH